MANLYATSSGEKVTQAQIDRRLTKTYRELYEGAPHPSCRGCGGRAQGSAHVIPQSRAKKLGKTELIWDPRNLLPACYKCNSIIESYKSQEFQNLMCRDYVIEFTRLNDPERYQLMSYGLE